MKEYTTSELAKKLDTTPTTIIRYIKKLKLDIKREKDKRNNKVRKITEKQAKAIEKAITSENKSSSKPSKTASSQPNDLTVNNLTTDLFQTLKDQLKEKDEHIKLLVTEHGEQIKLLDRKLENQQTLTRDLQDRVLMLNAPASVPEEVEKKNKSFYYLLIGIIIVFLIVLGYLILDIFNIPTWVIENL